MLRAALLINRASGYSNCLSGEVDLDPGTTDVEADCRVYHVLDPDLPTENRTELFQCALSSPPCFILDDEAACECR